MQYPVSPNVGLRAKTVSMDEARDFREYLFAKMFGIEAGTVAEARGASRRVIEYLKTASPATQSSSFTSPFAQVLERHISANNPRGAFESMRGDMQEVPLRTRVLVSTATITASEVGEGQPKPVRRLSLNNLDTEASKFVAIVALSLETMQEAPELAARLLAKALPEAVSRATDAYFIGKLAGEDVGESSGELNPTWSQMLLDLEELLRNVMTGELSRLYFIMRSRDAKALSRAGYENGVVSAKWNGGEVLGVPIVVSNSQSVGRITLADASGIVFGDDGIEIAESSQAALEFSDAPTNASGPVVTQTNLVDCFSTNTRALRAERRISVRVVDPSAVVSMSGTQWSAGGDSPDGL